LGQDRQQPAVGVGDLDQRVEQGAGVLEVQQDAVAQHHVEVLTAEQAGGVFAVAVDELDALADLGGLGLEGCMGLTPSVAGCRARPDLAQADTVQRWPQSQRHHC